MKLRLRQRAQEAGIERGRAHRRIIGGGRALGLLGIGALGLLLGLRPADAAAADPPLAMARRAAATAAAQEASAALDGVAGVVNAARDAARSGSALIIDGTDPPAPPLLSAAAALEGGAGSATLAVHRVELLRGILAAVVPAAAEPPPALTAAELLSIAGQLRQAAPVATAFVERRHAAEMTLAELGAALAALTRDEPERASEAIGRARAARETVAAWEEPPPELNVWLQTTGDMLTAAQQIADAVRAGDDAAASVAGDAYAAAAQRAGGADRALALSIAEAGSAITLAPLQRLARAADRVQAVHDWVASVLH